MRGTVTGRELSVRNEVNWGRSRGKTDDGLFEVEGGGAVGGGTWSRNGLREDCKDLGPLVWAHLKEGRAGDRGGRGLDRNRRYGGVKLRLHLGIWAWDRRVGLTRRDERGSGRERRSRDI